VGKDHQIDENLKEKYLCVWEIINRKVWERKGWENLENPGCAHKKRKKKLKTTQKPNV